MLVTTMTLFFFSSRRRHTRWNCDWSSDVCSSDLGLQATINIAVATVSVPTKGLSLPLVSAGGSGLVITCAALGLLYSITKFEHAADRVQRIRDIPVRRYSAEAVWEDLEVRPTDLPLPR